MNIRIIIDKEEFLAKLHQDACPKTCTALLQVLPLTGHVIHARWSGEAIWLPLPDLKIDVDFENHTVYPSRGELLFYPRLVSEKEILIPYGHCAFASRAGFLPGNHFASITGKLDKLAEIGKRVLWEGAKKISIKAS
ncbi:MAG: DUF3830 family protein [Thaumarchaeota archaeon]|nr:DUF3830 family protein [Nitrososphaerota archaeon]